MATLAGIIQNAGGATIASTSWTIAADGVTNDYATFVTARAWGISNLVTPATDRFVLTFPAGSIYIASVMILPSASATSCVHNMTVRGQGQGVTILKNPALSSCWWFGAYGHDTNFTNIATVNRGSTSVRTLTAADATAFPVGRWVLIAGIDMQTIWFETYGYPANAAFHDFAMVTASDSGTGIVTLDRGLKYAYKQTWPSLTAFAPGPGRMIALPPAWDLDMLVEDLTIDQPDTHMQAIKCDGRSMTFRRVTTTRNPDVNVCLNVSMNMSFVMENVTHPGPFEIDKLVDYVRYSDCAVGRISVQSSSVDLMEIENSTVTQLLGTTKRTIVRNTDIPSVRIGAYNHGISDEFEAIDSALGIDSDDEIGLVGGLYAASGVTSNSFGINNYFTVSSGRIVIPNGRIVTNAVNNGAGKIRLTVGSTAGIVSGKYLQVIGLDFVSPSATISADAIVTVVNSTTVDFDYTMPSGTFAPDATHPAQLVCGNPHIWAIPGKNLFLRGAQFNEYPIYITDITQDAGSIYVHTNMTGDDWPAVDLGGGGIIGLQTHPCARYTATGVSGSHQTVLEQQGATVRAPYYSYYNRTFDGSATTFPYDFSRFNMWGRFVEMRVNVITPYPGGGALSFNPFYSYTTYKADQSKYTWSPVINARIAGERVITPSSLTGTQTGDSGLQPPEAVWLTGQSLGPPSYSASPGGLTMSIMVTIITDQGIFQDNVSVAPLKLRLRA